MKSTLVWFALFVAVGSAAGFYWWQHSLSSAMEQQPAPSRSATTGSAAQESPQPQIIYPIPPEQPPAASTPGKPLPALNASDQPIAETLRVALGRQAITDLLVTDDVVRRIVATIDNLPRKKVAERLVPLQRPPGQLITNGEGAFVSLSPSNYARYTRYARLAQSTDVKQLVAAYTHYYPLLQQAYVELGYPKKYFNDRVVEVIDDLLAAPEAKDPVDLLRPKVLYEFADPHLEELSAGQKILLRMGPDNAAAVKAKLREIRAELAAQAVAKAR